MFVQFGPQHPGSHGLIKFTLELLGETINNSILYIGLLHSGTENLFETSPFYMGTPYMDSLDYVSTLTSEHAHVLGIEGLTDYQVASSAFLNISTVFDEITRINNHLMHISILTFDTGNFFLFFFFLEWSEHLMGFYEAVSGASLHAALYSPFETSFSYFNSFLIDNMFSYFNYFLFFFNNFFQPLLFFRVLKLSFMGIGSMSKNFVNNASISGVIASSCGLKYDASSSYQTTYAFYNFINFNIFTGDYGDLYDSMLLMVGEIVESVLIIVQTLFSVFVQSVSLSSDSGMGSLGAGAPLDYVFDKSKRLQYG